MSKFGKKFDDGIERELREDRPRPSSYLLASISDRVRERPSRHRSSLRVGFASAVTAALVTSLLFVGALGAAGGAVRHAASATISLVQPGHHSTAVGAQATPAAAPQQSHPQPGHNQGHNPGHHQYGHHKTTLCFRGKTISVDQNAVPALLANGATLGDCS